MVRRTIVLLAAAAAVLVPAGVASAGVTGPAFYVDGTLYRTVGTPTDLSGTGAPASSFDVIYEFGGLQPNVADSAPGDVGYNGGRWQVHALAFEDYGAAVAAVDANDSGDIDSDEEVEAALLAGLASDLGVVKSFECPTIPLARG
jgi:hypothetical protein